LLPIFIAQQLGWPSRSSGDNWAIPIDTLDARLAQTRDGKLGHLEFLEVLCEDEIARRDTAALARRVRRARFEQPNTFEDFDFTVSPKLPAAMLRDLSALRWLEAGESVILYRPVEAG
jgi:DNA replication protein DnaC